MPPRPQSLQLDASACAALFERARVTDLVILCCESSKSARDLMTVGIAIGVLFYALLHDLVARYNRQRSREAYLPPGFSLPSKA